MARKPFIEDVSPARVSACANEVTFVIKGTNIWRSTEVYLGGLKAEEKNIRVLPDMEGVTATFNVSKLFSSETPISGNPASPPAPEPAPAPDQPAPTQPAPPPKRGTTGAPVPVTPAANPAAGQSGLLWFIPSALAAPAVTPQPAPTKKAATTTTVRAPNKTTKTGNPASNTTPQPIPATVRSLDFETRTNARTKAEDVSERIELTVATRSGTDSVPWIRLTAENNGSTDCARRRLVAPDRF